jgi:sodium-dependent dicarboxylate transporter 2/3/5
VCAAIAVLVAWLPEHAGLGAAGRLSLGIVVLAAGLWITEAIPAFSVALLVIALQILLLGQPGGALLPEDAADGWQTFTLPWAAPPMWLFFGGLILARAAERTGLAQWLADAALRASRGDALRVLLSLVALTFSFSMFVSNTATTAMMLATLAPLLAARGDRIDARARVALLTSVAVAANVGGMGTLIGTPPNAIAAGLLDNVHPIRFIDWMVIGLPPALLLVALQIALVGRGIAGARFDGTPPAHDRSWLERADVSAVDPDVTRTWQKVVVMVVFTATVLLWTTEALHGLPTAVVSFLPIVALSATGVIRTAEIRSLPWDVLLLLAGGISLGVGVAESGLAAWLADKATALGDSPWVVALALAWLTSLLSNLMSNTAAANLVLPVAIALGDETGGAVMAAQFAVPVALAASTAMCLPISTPPNALVYATGHVTARDFLRSGVLVGLLAPPIAVAWCFFVL